MLKTQFLRLKFKKYQYVLIVNCDFPFIEWNARFTTVPNKNFV